MEKNISHPTDAKLYHRARERLVKWCEKENITLRQKYPHVSKKTLHDVSRYAHARQMRRAKSKTKQLKGLLGRVYRDALRKGRELGEIPALALNLTSRLDSFCKKKGFRYSKFIKNFDRSFF